MGAVHIITNEYLQELEDTVKSLKEDLEKSQILIDQLVAERDSYWEAWGDSLQTLKKTRKEWDELINRQFEKFLKSS